MSTAKGDSTQNERSRKPGVTLIEVLVAVIVVGVMAAVFVPKIIRRRREAAVERAFAEVQTVLVYLPSPRVKELVTAFPELANAEDQDGWTLLHGAALWGHKDAAESLLANGADVNARCESDWIPLGYARFKGLPDGGAGFLPGEFGKVLLAKGPEENEKHVVGWTPLHCTAEMDRKDVAELLLANGADVNARDEGDGTPLHLAWHEDVAELLLAAGADVNAKAKNGWTPLHVAWRKNVAELLIAKGADVNAKAEDGRTPLHGAAGEGNMDVSELLLAKGADVNAKDKDGWTPLHCTTEMNRKDVAELLLAKGTDVNARAKDVAELLLANGADVNAKTEDGLTLLDMARANGPSGYTELVELLKKHGASESD